MSQNIPVNFCDECENIQLSANAVEVPIGGGIEQVQVDYNQNDEQAIDYIKNRPFYEETGSNITTSIDLISAGDPEDEGDGNIYYIFDGSEEQYRYITIESVITIIYNGVRYESLGPFEVDSDSESSYYGNPAIMEIGDDNGIPFLFCISNGGSIRFFDLVIKNTDTFESIEIIREAQNNLLFNVEDLVSSRPGGGSFLLRSGDVTSIDTLKIIFNGQEYICNISYSDDMSGYIFGNEYLINGTGADNGLPFVGVFSVEERTAQFKTIDEEYDWQDISVSTVSANVIIKQIDEKFIPSTIARNEEVDQKIKDAVSDIESSSDYVTTNTDQTGLSGTKEWSSKLVFNPETGFKFNEGSNNDPTELNWSEKYLNLFRYVPDQMTDGADYHHYSSLLDLDKLYLRHWGALSADEYASILTLGGSLKISESRGGGVVSEEVSYAKSAITYKKKDYNGEEKSCILSFPNGDGTIATQEWVSSNSSAGLNIENGTNDSIQQSLDTPIVDFTGRNPNAISLASELGINLEQDINTGASGQYSASFNGNTMALAKRSMAINNKTIAYGEESFAANYQTVALGDGSASFGTMTVAKGRHSFAEGHSTQAIGEESHAMGYNTIAVGRASLAQGGATEANGQFSYAGGYKTVAGADNQTVVGQWNKNKTNTLFEVGCGTNEDNRLNALEVLTDGRVKIYGAPKDNDDAVRYQDISNMIIDELAKNPDQLTDQQKQNICTKLGAMPVKISPYSNSSGELKILTYEKADGKAGFVWAAKNSATANTLARRDDTGSIRVAPPTRDDHTATKKYVDDKVDNAGGGGLTLYKHIITVYETNDGGTSTIELVSPCSEIKEVFGGYWVEEDPETAYNIYQIPDFFQGYYGSERIVYFRYEYLDQYIVGTADYWYSGSIYERFIQITNYRIEPYTPSYH